jgi:hypothetical protein
MSSEALDALDAARAWTVVVGVVCDEIPSVEIDHARDGVWETDEDVSDAPTLNTSAPHEEFAVDSALVARLSAELHDDARERFRKLARELDRAGFQIVRAR